MASSDLTGSYVYSDTLKGIYYGPGSTKDALPKLLDTIGATKVLVVTGRTLYTKTNVVSVVEDILKSRGQYGATFYEIGEHSPVADIRRGVAAFDATCADAIVSVGGGSPIDAAKVILHFVREARGGGPYLRQIAIPTTLSAAEYTTLAGYTNEEGHKMLVASTEITPAGIILDAELTLPTPERLWLSTGLRSLDHAVENLYRPLVPPPLKHLAYAAIADLFTYLPRAKADPHDVAARQKLQLASWMSIWPFRLENQGSYGLSHSLGHKLGAKYGIPHGITSCLTLAPVVALKADTASEADKAWLAGALRHIAEPPTGSAAGDVCALSARISRLVEELGLRSTLEQYGVPRGDIAEVARLTLGSEEDPLYGRIVGLLENLYA